MGDEDKLKKMSLEVSEKNITLQKLHCCIANNFSGLNQILEQSYKAMNFSQQ